LCQQAAQLEPTLATPYAEALLYAELAEDAKGMEWAAGNLLKQDWPADGPQLQRQAQQKLETLARTLKARDRVREAERLLQAARQTKRRDLVIKLAWQGEADLDLKVTEPSGSVCSTLNRQTVGGGILVGDSLLERASETYLAAEAFSGEYQVKVQRVYGKPLGERAQLRVIRHQGTDDEEEDLITVDLKDNKPIPIRLDGGRRKELAYVPPTPTQQAADTPAESPDKVLNQLRAAADPEVTGINPVTVRGGAGSGGLPSRTTRVVQDEQKPVGDKVLFQNKVRSFVQNSLEVTAQAVLSSDRRSVRLSLTPAFNTVGLGAQPVVRNPLIPGAP
jgi:hypothetical protein